MGLVWVCLFLSSHKHLVNINILMKYLRAAVLKVAWGYLLSPRIPSRSLRSYQRVLGQKNFHMAIILSVITLN